jgi:hypothetical protein
MRLDLTLAKHAFRGSPSHSDFCTKVHCFQRKIVSALNRKPFTGLGLRDPKQSLRIGKSKKASQGIG